MAVSLLTISRLLVSPPSLYLSTTLFPPKTAALSSKLSFAISLRLKYCCSPKPLRFSTAKSVTNSATIVVSDKLPESTLSYLDSAGDVQTVTISDLTKGKNVVLFAVPGAFTLTCSQKNLPGFVEKSVKLRSKGVDTIACISVNDAFVLKAWKEDLKIRDEVLILSDGNGDFTRAIRRGGREKSGGGCTVQVETKDSFTWVGRIVNQVWFIVQRFSGKLESNLFAKCL